MLVAVVLAAWTSIVPQQADGLPVDSRLDRVTVFPQRALVERVFEAEADRAGVVRVRVGPLPAQVDRASYQVKVEEASSPVTVQGLDVQMRNGRTREDAAAARLREQLDEVAASRRALQTELVSVESRQAVVDALIASVATADPPLDGAALDQVMQEVAQRATALDRERAELEQRVDAAEARADELNRELGALTSEAQPYQELVLPLKFDGPGTARLRLEYLVGSASWEPSYDIRVSADLTGVQVSQVARVRQSTGEDWSDVAMWLSTSTPSTGLQAPSLPRRIFRLPYEDGPDFQGLAGLGYDAGGPVNASARVPRDEVERAPQIPVAGVSTVVSDNQPVRFVLASLPLAVRPERYVVPSISDHGYLRAEVRYEGQEKLVGGRARVYFGPDFLGETALPMLTPGDRTRIELGRDPHVRVSFSTVQDDRKQPGLLSSTARLTRIFQADVQLTAAARGPVTVVVEERMPRSLDERVTVRPVRLQPSPADLPEDRLARDEQSLWRWRFQLAPGASQRLTWGYEVAFNEDLDPVLVER